MSKFRLFPAYFHSLWPFCTATASTDYKQALATDYSNMERTWRRSTAELVAELEDTIEQFGRLLARRKPAAKADQATIRDIIRAGVMNLRKSRTGSCEPLQETTGNVSVRPAARKQKRQKSVKRRPRSKENQKPGSRSNSRTCKACFPY